MSQPENIWDPSKGATGIMLKTANAILIRVKYSNNTKIDSVKSPDPFKNRSIMPPMKAKIKLAAGPAAATFIISILGFLKNLGSTGTGFAQPNPTNKIMSDPIISKCAIGFKESRPIRAAVVSPHFAAIHA